MKLIMLLLLPTLCFSQINDNDFPVYNGNDLGITYTVNGTLFKVWSPEATVVKLRLYQSGIDGEAVESFNMSKGKSGTWQITVNRDIKNLYYTFQVKVDDKWLDETPDIYARAVGVNGKRGMIINMKETDPQNWEHDKKPLLKNFNDIIIYESHIRDISVSNNSGIKHKGKFLGLAETGTKSPDGMSTGLDHLKELGITHVHLLPAFDFNSVDETRPERNEFNWGYDPLNYNVPEGSYSTDAYDGKVRIKEFKQMVQALHANGIRVIMDVVYNHTCNLQTAFNRFVPGYYYRHNSDGSYSNASACGNETASEKPMMRKFILASVAYWAKEYHIDGFRFDLMGVHDIETMNLVSDTLHKIDPTIFIYGEGWTAGSSPLPEEQRAVKKNTYRLKKIAAFSDDIRDGLRGPYDKVTVKGFISGQPGTAESVKFGIVASTPHPQINYKEVNYSKAPWAAQPYQTISYVSCHDDNTLFDRIRTANPDATEAEMIKMDKLAQSIVLTSQGVSFIHSGAELLRTKQGIANSFNAPDSINEIDWSRKTKYHDVFSYYKGLIALRKAHPAFRMTTAEMIKTHLKFIDTTDPLIIAYRITGNANHDKWKNILVILNGNTVDKKVSLPPGKWVLAADGNNINEKGLKQMEAAITVPGSTAFILYN